MTTPSRLARCVTLAAALALAPLAAGAAPASSRTYALSNPALGAPLGAMDYSGLLSLEFAPTGIDVGPRLSGEAMYNVMDLAPNARLKLGLRGALAFHGTDFAGTFWLFDLVPDAKITVAVSDLVALYGDVGLGFGVLNGNDNSSLELAFQMGAGIAYVLNPHVNLLGEIRLDFYTGGATTFVSFPSVGLQFH